MGDDVFSARASRLRRVQPTRDESPAQKRTAERNGPLLNRSPLAAPFVVFAGLPIAATTFRRRHAISRQGGVFFPPRFSISKIMPSNPPPDEPTAVLHPFFS
jgi:hypothetical protein